MSDVEWVLDELEDEPRWIMIDGKPVGIRAVIDKIIQEDGDSKKRKLSTG